MIRVTKYGVRMPYWVADCRILGCEWNEEYGRMHEAHDAARAHSKTHLKRERP